MAHEGFHKNVCGSVCILDSFFEEQNKLFDVLIQTLHMYFVKSEIHILYYRIYTHAMCINFTLSIKFLNFLK